jgi:hypothetical protein
VLNEREEIAAFVLIPVFHRLQSAQNANISTPGSRN